jgi:colanic acid biosynthesis glycosyl transferase WcaI
VLRGYLFVPRRVSASSRLLHEATFCLFAFLNCLRAGRQDAVVVFSPPFLLGLVGRFFAWVWRCPFVINIQDLPLDAATALGMVKIGPFSRFVGAVERWVYRSADLVTTISDAMLAVVLGKGVTESRSMVVANWIDVAAAGRPQPVGRFLSRHAQASGKFLTVYAGNFGVKQGIDSLLRLAKAMEHDDRHHFFLIGDGADKPRLMRIAEELALSNVTFAPLLDPVGYQEMLTDVKMVFVAQKRGAGNNFFPSKLLGLMAQGKPLLVSADPESELAGCVKRWGCGRVCAFDDTAGLARQLGELAQDTALLRSLGERGRTAVLAFDRERVLSAWCRRIREVARRG